MLPGQYFRVIAFCGTLVLARLCYTNTDLPGVLGYHLLHIALVQLAQRGPTWSIGAECVRS